MTIYILYRPMRFTRIKYQLLHETYLHENSIFFDPVKSIMKTSMSFIIETNKKYIHFLPPPRGGCKK